MQTTFFGTDVDLTGVWRWLLEMPGVRVCESYSRHDQPNRWFASWEQLVAADDAFKQVLAAWSEDFGSPPVGKYIRYTEETQRALQAQGCTELRSPAFISVWRNNYQNGCLACAYVSWWSEKGARQRSIIPEEVLDDVHWKNLEAVAKSVTRRLRRESPATLRGYAIMPDAWARLKAGEIKLWNWGTECAYPSELIKEKRRRPPRRAGTSV